MNAGSSTPARLSRGCGTAEAVRGSALIEATIALPLLLLLLLNVVNFGLYIFGWITVNNAARAAAEYRILNKLAVGGQSAPSYSDVVTKVFTNEVSSLPNAGSPTPSGYTHVILEICSNVTTGGSAVITCSPTQVSGHQDPPSDPVDPTRTIISAEVEYDYSSIFQNITLPILNVPLSVLPTPIYRRVLMRSLQ